MYKLKSGSYILSEPIFILPIDCIQSDFIDTVFISLGKSREILESEEDMYWLGNTLLKKMKESSFDKLYRNSVSCIVSIKNNFLNIVPQKYVSKELGLNIQEEKSFLFSLESSNNSLIAEKIKEVLTLNESNAI